MLRGIMVGLTLCAGAPIAAGESFRFASLDGGEIALDDRQGKPILAVPSDDFNHEWASEAEVKKYCALTFDLTPPMTEITAVTGPEAHPFHAWERTETAFRPRWNFNKVLIGPDGRIVETFGAAIKPESDVIAGRIEAFLE